MTFKPASRRYLLMGADASALGMNSLILYCAHNVSAAQLTPMAFATLPPTSREALQKLLQGNLRFQ